MRGRADGLDQGAGAAGVGAQVGAGLVGGHDAEEQHHREHGEGQHGDLVIASRAIDGQQGLVGGHAEGVRGNFEDQRQHAQAGAAQQQALYHQARQLAVGGAALGGADVAIHEEGQEHVVFAPSPACL